VNDNNFNYGEIMQCIVTYVTGMYLSKISYDISVFSFGYQTSGHSVFM
jgi:hypothetical protein